MDIYEYLKMDHKEVSELFKQFEKSDSKIRKQEIVAMITQELLIHSEAEQETFYVLLEQYEESREKAEHGLKEHKEIQDQIKLLRKAKKFDAAWEKEVLHLKSLVEHHVSEEEGAMFRKAKKVISDEEAVIIKEKMHNLKKELLLELNA